MSDADADAVIESRVASDQVREAALRSSLLEVYALETKQADSGSRRMILRKVSPPAELPRRPQPAATPEISLPEGQPADYRAEREREPVNLQLHAYVYDDAYSEIELRLDGEAYTAWTNLNFRYLSPIGTFQSGTRDYSYFGMTTAVSREAEQTRIEQATAMGYSGFTSRWKEPPVRFTQGMPEYVLVTENADPVPGEVHRQLDDLMAYYAANEESLRVSFENARELRAARERHEAAFPPAPPGDIVLNYSRAREASPR